MHAHIMPGLAMQEFSDYAVLEIPVVFHVFHYFSAGLLTAESIGAQIDALNTAFSGTGHELGTDSKIRFRLQDVHYNQSLTGYQLCHTRKTDVLNWLNSDPLQAINIVTCSGEGYLGWTYGPWSLPEHDPFNAIFINWRTFPGATATMEQYNLGLSAAHEMGHYFGLLHTFGAAGCGDDAHGGDHVADTPIERVPQTECVHTRDSCPNDPGLDPSWSFMDYTPDACMQRFSAGQVSRMRAMITEYKPRLADTSAVVSRAASNAGPVCEQYTCGADCQGECGWSRKRDKCIPGGTTNNAELSLGPGCPNPVPTTYQSSPPTAPPAVGSPTTALEIRLQKRMCKAIKCGRECAAPCGWSTSKDKCIFNGHTTSAEQLLGDGCGDVSVPEDDGDTGIDRIAEEDSRPTSAPTAITGPRSCMDLGWKTVPNMGVCGASRFDGTCHVRNSVYRDAWEVCVTAGGRLCSRDELDDGASVGTGCGLNGKLVWSSSACVTSGGLPGFLVGLGKYSDSVEPICEATTSRVQHSVRCCGDVNVGGGGVGLEAGAGTTSVTNEATGMSTGSVTMIVGIMLAVLGAAFTVYHRKNTRASAELREQIDCKTEFTGDWDTDCETDLSASEFGWSDSTGATTVVTSGQDVTCKHSRSITGGVSVDSAGTTSGEWDAAGQYIGVAGHYTAAAGDCVSHGKIDGNPLYSRGLSDASSKLSNRSTSKVERTNPLYGRSHTSNSTGSTVSADSTISARSTGSKLRMSESAESDAGQPSLAISRSTGAPAPESKFKADKTSEL